MRLRHGKRYGSCYDIKGPLRSLQKQAVAQTNISSALLSALAAASGVEVRRQEVLLKTGAL